MRRRFFALGYVFFALLTVTGLVMVFSFIERLSTKPTLTTSDLIEQALSDTSKLNADPAYIIESSGRDLHAALKNFHYYPEINFIAQEHRSNCLSCHTPLPHNNDIKQRAFLNMHGNFIACQTCHNTGSEGEYHWFDIERNTIAEVLLNDVPMMSVQLVSIANGAPAFTKQADPAFIAKYATVINDLEKQDQLCKDEYRKDLEQAFTCKKCHTSKDAAIDWNALGYSEERALELSTLSTPSVFQKYDEFYIPSF